MITIQEFIEAERRMMSRLDKVLYGYPEIHPTSFFGPPRKQSKLEMVLRPSLIGRLIVIPFILLGSLFFISFVNILINQMLPVLIPVTGLLFLCFILFMLIWNLFLNPNYNYHIRINSHYIEARRNRFFWKDVSDTWIMTRMTGRTSNTWLIILNLDGSIEQLDLQQFYISNKKLAGIVEYYKEQYERTTEIPQYGSEPPVVLKG
jgi:hypothetical protein